MTKVNGKRIRRKGEDTSIRVGGKHFGILTNNIFTEVVNHPSVTRINPSENLAMAPVVNANETAAQKKEELSGYIFMCNGSTKPECYINRVFGLPAGRKEVVEKIKPGIKLFLFDTDVKLLYGVYEAVSTGGMNLQPTAFGGRFPAQVRFKICVDCLPLPLSALRTAIKDNFQGSKFAPELNDQQVRDILLLFKPIVTPPSATLHPLAPSAAHGPWVQPPAPSGPHMPPATIYDRQLTLPLNPPLLNRRYQPYTARPLQNCLPQTNASQYVLKNGLNPYPQHHYPSASYEAPLHESYSRYMTTSEAYPNDQTVGYNSLALPTVVNHIDRTHGHNTYPTPTPLYGSTPPPYSGSTYVDAQSSVPVSSYYSFAGSMQITR